MKLSVDIPDELAPLIEGAFAAYGGYQDNVPNPVPNPHDGSPWNPTVPNSQTLMDFAGQIVARMILDIVHPYAMAQAVEAAKAQVDLAMAAIPPIVFTGT